MLDQLRELRFLLPPFFFFASLASGAYLDPAYQLLCKLHQFKDSQAIVIASVGAATVPVGFLIGVVSMMLLAGLSRLTRWQQWDVPHSESTVGAMWRSFGLSREKRLDLQAVSTFDRVFIHKEILDWLVRRWTAFLVSVNSTVALLLGILVVPRLLGIHPPRYWYYTMFGTCGLLLLHAGIALYETRAMGEFQAAIAERKSLLQFE